MDGELSEIRKKKLLRLQQQLEQQYQQQHQIQQDEETQLSQQIEQLEHIVRQKLSKEALSRYGNIKTAHPETAVQLLVILGQAIQAGQIKREISDEELRELLSRIAKASRKEFTIKKT